MKQRTWLITDTHYNHKRIIEKCERPEDYEAQINRNWCLLVKPTDTIIHLGDVIMYKNNLLKGILEKLPGRKILVRGNHDAKSRSWYERNGFHYCCDALQLGSVLLTHKPCKVLPDGVRLNVHGHWHNRPKEPLSPQHKLLSIERTNYKPVLMEQFVC